MARGSTAQNQEPPPRRFRTERLGLRLPALLRAPLGKRGFAAVEIITHWSLIVGERLAEFSQPERLAFPKGERANGTLEVRVDGPLALELQHLEPLVLEKVNGFCGFKAAARIKLLRGRLRGRRIAPPPLPPLTAQERERLDAAVTAVADDNLQAALARLGEAVYRRRRGERQG